MSGSRIVIKDEDRRDNAHPGDMLREDFLIGSEIAIEEVAESAGVDIAVLCEIVASRHNIDAATGVRLSLDFGMSKGFFFGLQLDYDLEEARNSFTDELARIVPRAA